MATPIDVLPQSAVLVDGKVFQFPGEAEARRFEAAAQEAGSTTVQLLPALPPAARPLYELETHLAALLDTEDLVPAEMEQEYALELHSTLVATVDKRDRVGQFRQHLQSQVAFAKAEKLRLEERQQFYERAIGKLDAYITKVIDMLGVDAKGKRKKLVGNVLTLGLHGCDVRAEVTDAEAVPSKYMRAEVTLPLDTWTLICDSLDFDLRDQVMAEAKVRKDVHLSTAKADLKAGIAVPGCQTAGGSYVEVK